ncbi:molybdate ABC transporter substrate-binding protein [Aeromicrobium sp. Leaf350]|uniref:molybdate ABC transporter substrate-binding protein n=1 Tax=Aeromicrobium sp. Leaf350 TaxID=2876565 RepID=UPI001E60E8D8|nr:molybdate ABC transporter substrate-binding protein [Aeromicrobium sp. Leaf350]
MTQRRWLVAAAASVLLVAGGCGSGEDGANEGGPTEVEQVTLTVHAAASLKGTFTEIVEEFESEHEAVTVTLNVGGSSDLVAQIQSGVPADVFASADVKNMDKLGDLAVGPEDFATNTLEIVVPRGNPADISSFDDLAGDDVKLVTCAVEVPCGSATAAVAEEAGVELSPVSQEQSVTDVLGKVASGEADAGLVYVTDVKAASDAVEGITFRESDSVVNTYPISVVEGSEHADLAQEFMELVLATFGQQVLADAGFGKP